MNYKNGYCRINQMKTLPLCKTIAQKDGHKKGAHTKG